MGSEQQGRSQDSESESLQFSTNLVPLVALVDEGGGLGLILVGKILLILVDRFESLLSTQFSFSYSTS